MCGMNRLAACLVLFLAASLPAQVPPGPPVPDEDGAVTFRLRVPKGEKVLLHGQWRREPFPLEPGEKGMWSVKVDAVPAGVWEYSFSVDGLNVIDSFNPALKPQRQPTKNILHIPSNPPAAWDWQDVPHGTVHMHQYASKVVGRQRELLVYTPPGYEKDTAQLPLLVLQHGSGDNQRAWTEHGKAHWIFDNLISAKKMVPAVVVMLDGHPLGMVPREDIQKRMEAFDVFERELFEEALPLVEAVYRVEKKGSRRGFAGLSMGGSQALQIGLRHPDRLGWIGAFSTAPSSPEIAKQLVADPDRLNANLKLLWIACGKDDFLLQRHEEFLALLKEKGVRHIGRQTEGDHSWPVWRRYLTTFAPLLFRD